MKKYLLAILLLCVTVGISAQEQEYLSAENDQELFFGLGFGLDYGGLGVKLEYLPTKHLGLFGGLGYNLLSFGYNVGASFKVLPDNKVTPTVSLLYGYNAVIKVEGASEYNMTSYGVTFGLGVDFFNAQGNKWSVNLFVPIRSKAFMDNYDDVRNSSYITLNQELLPIAFSVGYNFKIR